MKTKLLKKDYNEELEEIAEQKGFEKEAQNLLLSMIYKVDGAYKDYQTAKRAVPSKDEFQSNILEIIKNNCKEIVIAKPNSVLEKELQDSKFRIWEGDKGSNNERKVIFFPNEKIVLYNVIKLGLPIIDENLSLEEKAILSAIQIGKCIAYSEVIRDFNGFSWSTIKKEVESIECNAIYTDLIYLLGVKKVDSFNSSNIKKLKKYVSNELYNEIKKVAINFYLLCNQEQNEKLNKIIESYKSKLDEMKKQLNFVESLSKAKKKMFAKIKKIDKTLNNSLSLREEYLEKNKNLPNEKKIFSISHYEEMLQKEREQITKKLNEYSKLQNPIEYVKIKDNLQSQIDFYNSLKKVNILDLQRVFLSDFEKELQNKNNDDELVDYIYQIRYLKFLPINKKEKLRDKINFENLEKSIIEKAIKKEVIIPISNNKETDYALLKSIFDTRNVSLDESYIRLCVEDGKLKSEIYDGDMLDSSNFIELPQKSNIHLRKTKKVKIFLV